MNGIMDGWMDSLFHLDMVKYMKEVVLAKKQQLTPEERNLFSVAYKNVVGATRSSWRILSDIENKRENEGKEKDPLLCEYKSKVEEELKQITTEVVRFLDDHLLSQQFNDILPEMESKTFYYKMKGDYCRYHAEIDKIKNDKSIREADQAYKEAALAAQSLPQTNPIRLGMALNHSVFFYEIKNEPDEACRIAKKAFDEAIAELDQLREDSYKDSTLIMQLLRDNLTLWTSEVTTIDKDSNENEDF
jgi:uncharacterized protein YicC (UPF0701 family)